jgi:ATP-binding cassette subfamily C protein
VKCNKIGKIMIPEEVNTTRAYTWQSIFAIVKQHKSALVLANVIAIFAAAISVPVPLLMPLLVDEVLLDKPGKITELLSEYIS